MEREIPEAFRSLAAKSCREDSGNFLPLWMHAIDTGEVMARLVREWLPEPARRAMGRGLPEGGLEKQDRGRAVQERRGGHAGGRPRQGEGGAGR